MFRAKPILYLIVKYDQYLLKILVNDKNVIWFDAFLGVGYEFYEVRSKVILIFDKKKTLFDAWNKIIKWWPDNEIKMRFVETNHSYDFILYGDSSALEARWVFLKALKLSQHYKTFRDDYEGAAILRLAVYRPKRDSYELELFDYSKRVTDVMFLEEALRETDSIVLKSSNMLRGSALSPQ
jgi:hypothetical protein